MCESCHNAVVITVHHLDHSRSQRVLWILEELEVPYEIVTYQRDPKTLLAPAALTNVHPLGKSPVLVDGDKVLAESGAILEYLVETYGNGKLVPPRGTQAYLDYRYFMHYAEGSLMPYLLLALLFTKLETAPAPFFVKPIMKRISSTLMEIIVNPNLQRHVGFLAQHLEKTPWFAGDELTAADIQMSYAIDALVTRTATLKLSPKIVALANRMHERPAYQRAIAKGGPVMLDLT